MKRKPFFIYKLITSRILFLTLYAAIYAISYLILCKGSISFCDSPLPFDTWSSVYYIDNPDAMFNSSASTVIDSEVLQNRNKAYSSLDKLGSALPTEPAAFNATIEAKNLYGHFRSLLQNNVNMNLKEAAVTSIVYQSNPVIFAEGCCNPGSDCTEIKLNLYAMCSQIPKDQRESLAYLITTYDLYFATFSEGYSVEESKDITSTMPPDVFDERLQFVRRHIAKLLTRR